MDNQFHKEALEYVENHTNKTNYVMSLAQAISNSSAVAHYGDTVCQLAHVNHLGAFVFESEDSSIIVELSIANDELHEEKPFLTNDTVDIAVDVFRPLDSHYAVLETKVPIKLGWDLKELGNDMSNFFGKVAQVMNFAEELNKAPVVELATDVSTLIGNGIEEEITAAIDRFFKSVPSDVLLGGEAKLQPQNEEAA